MCVYKLSMQTGSVQQNKEGEKLGAISSPSGTSAGPAAIYYRYIGCERGSELDVLAGELAREARRTYIYI